MKRLLLTATLLLGTAAAPVAPVPDIVIRGGRVLDGAGSPWINADIAIRDGRITEVGQVAARGAREIDAKGRYVAPGFIDMMDQSGRVLLKNGAAENKIRMGVTTVIAGEGGTPVPAAEIPGYFATLEKQGIAVNFGTYYATMQARQKVIGDADGRPTPAQMDAMRAEVATAMQAGVFGISTALVYSPGSFQTTGDLIELGKVAAKCNGYYATHMRDEADKLVPAIEEAITIGEKSGAKVEIFHLKAGYRPGWGKLMPQAVAAIAAARARGVDIAADMYPYAAGGTGLDITVPTWVWADGRDKALERLKDPAVRARLKREHKTGSPGWSNFVEASGGWDNVVLANSHGETYAKFHGQSIAAVAKALGNEPADVAWDILIAALPNRAMALYFMMGEPDIALAMQQPWVSIGSDAGAAETYGAIDGLGLPHPRAYGNAVRVIAEYVRRRPVLTLEDAVRKMTGWPAARMGLFDRGLIRPGMRADIVVFDLDKLDDVASYASPLASPTGITDVLVNGVPALEAGRATSARAGQVLRHACETNPAAS